MDFSSTSRALESLTRRQPPVDDEALEACRTLLPFFSSSSDAAAAADDDDDSIGTAVVVEALTVLLRHDSRWESLAVGLCVSTELLLLPGASKGHHQHASKHPSSYVEFPRVPPLVADVASTNTTTTRQQQQAPEAQATAATTTAPPPRPPYPIDSSSSSSRRRTTLNRTAAQRLTSEQKNRLCREVHSACLQHLDHSEPRVRTWVARAIPAYLGFPASGSDARGSSEADQEPERQPHVRHARELYSRLTASIRRHLEEGRSDVTSSSHQKLSTSSAGALDDTTGWRALETNWLCLKALVRALINTNDYFEILPLEPSVLDDCRRSAVEHVSRHIRAAAMQALEQWILAASSDSRDGSSQLQEKEDSAYSSPLRETTIAVLKAGLDDNWSQVRMAACVLCRVFLTALQQSPSSQSSASPQETPQSPPATPLDFPKHDDVYRVALPRVCLNRFYSAHGVKLYSHETWFQVVRDRGVDVVALYLPAFVRYYVRTCDADSHVVRESACQALAELAKRLGSHPTYRAQLSKHVGTMLQALVVGFHDESWPVRDEAGLACATMCKSYPDECRNELPLLWDRWTEQLTDQIWSVRQRASVALGDAVEGYPELWTKVLELVRKLLPSARHEPAMTKEAYRAHMDQEAHRYRPTNGRVLGCMDCIVDRPKAPWEATDGCIYMIRELTIRGSAELSPNPMTDDVLLPLLKELADVCRVQHFPQSDDLRTTLWRQLPSMAHALGKDRFKRHYLDLFLDLLFRSLESRAASQLSIHAAGQCAEELSKLVGASIFRGRLEDYQRELFDRVMMERARAPKGPGDDSGFSHMGPPGLLDRSGLSHPPLQPLVPRVRLEADERVR